MLQHTGHRSSPNANSVKADKLWCSCTQGSIPKLKKKESQYKTQQCNYLIVQGQRKGMWPRLQFMKQAPQRRTRCTTAPYLILISQTLHCMLCWFRPILFHHLQEVCLIQGGQKGKGLWLGNHSKKQCVFLDSYTLSKTKSREIGKGKVLLVLHYCSSKNR